MQSIASFAIHHVSINENARYIRRFSNCSLRMVFFAISNTSHRQVLASTLNSSMRFPVRTKIHRTSSSILKPDWERLRHIGFVTSCNWKGESGSARGYKPAVELTTPIQKVLPELAHAHAAHCQTARQAGEGARQLSKPDGEDAGQRALRSPSASVQPCAWLAILRSSGGPHPIPVPSRGGPLPLEGPERSRRTACVRADRGLASRRGVRGAAAVGNRVQGRVGAAQAARAWQRPDADQDHIGGDHRSGHRPALASLLGLTRIGRLAGAHELVGDRERPLDRAPVQRFSGVSLGQW